MNISERATAYHESGNNCAQSVFMACGEYTGVDEQLARAISAGFGGGVRSGEICGAISGAIMVIGKYLTDIGRKELIAAETKRFVSEFREHFGYVRCIELKQNRCPCADLIEYAAQLCEEYIKSYSV